MGMTYRRVTCDPHRVFSSEIPLEDEYLSLELEDHFGRADSGPQHKADSLLGCSGLAGDSSGSRVSAAF